MKFEFLSDVVTTLKKSKYQTISVTSKGLVRLILNWSIVRKMAKTGNFYVISNVSPVLLSMQVGHNICTTFSNIWANLFMKDEDKHIFYYWKLAETLVVWVNLIGDFSSPLLSMQEMKRTQYCFRKYFEHIS